MKFFTMKVLLFLLLLTTPLLTYAQETRITIAIGAIKGTDRANALRVMLTTGFIKESRYILLERDGIADLAMESIVGGKNLALLEGADYVLLADVTKADISTEEGGALIFSGSSQVVEIEFDLRLVDVQTGRIVYSDHVANRTKGNTSVNIAGIKGGGGNKDLLGELLRPIVQQQIDLITKKLYPTRVIAHNKGMVILNFGSDRFEVGNEISILELGESVFDPDTGILLYQESETYDKAIVFEVNDKISKAYLVKNDKPNKVNTKASGVELVLDDDGEPIINKKGLKKLVKLHKQEK